MFSIRNHIMILNMFGETCALENGVINAMPGTSLGAPFGHTRLWIEFHKGEGIILIKEVNVSVILEVDVALVAGRPVLEIICILSPRCGGSWIAMFETQGTYEKLNMAWVGFVPHAIFSEP